LTTSSITTETLKASLKILIGPYGQTLALLLDPALIPAQNANSGRSTFRQSWSVIISDRSVLFGRVSLNFTLCCSYLQYKFDEDIDKFRKFSSIPGTIYLAARRLRSFGWDHGCFIYCHHTSILFAV